MDREAHALSFDAKSRLWRVETRAADGVAEVFLARNLVSSAPIRELAEAISPSPASLPAARALGYRDFLTVVLIGRSAQQLPDNWVYIHDPAVKVGRVQNFRSWSPEMIPDETSTCLGLEYFCFDGDGLWSASTPGFAKREIGHIGLMDPADVVVACGVRQETAYPVSDEHYRDTGAAVRAELEALYPSLHLVGRNGMHKYNNQDHAMMTGMLTAPGHPRPARRCYDTWDVNEDAEYARGRRLRRQGGPGSASGWCRSGRPDARPMTMEETLTTRRDLPPKADRSLSRDLEVLPGQRLSLAVDLALFWFLVKRAHVFYLSANVVSVSAA